MLKAMLELLPCRPAELSRFRTAIGDAFAAAAARPPPAGVPKDHLVAETAFMLRSQATLHELNERYFPQSGMTDKEVVAATAARVGLAMPKTGPGDAAR